MINSPQVIAFLFKNHWFRVTQRCRHYTCLEDFIIHKQRINIGNNNLPYKTKGGVLVPHCYDRPINTSTHLSIPVIIEDA